MTGTIIIADITLDTAKNILSNASGREAKRLGEKRGRLLAILMRSPGSWFSTDMLHERLYSEKQIASKKIIKVYVSHLRATLNEMTSEVYIDSSREGYCLKVVPPF